MESLGPRKWELESIEGRPMKMAQKTTAIMENSMVVPQKTKNRVSIWSINPFPMISQSQWQNYMHPYIHSSITHYSQDWKQPKCLQTDKWLKKMWCGTSAVVLWLKNQSANAGDTGSIPGLGRPHMPRTSKPMGYNYWTHTPQLLKLTCLQPLLHNQRSHHNEKPVPCNKE